MEYRRWARWLPAERRSGSQGNWFAAVMVWRIRLRRGLGAGYELCAHLLRPSRCRP
jgi:hypothetical protein